MRNKGFILLLLTTLLISQGAWAVNQQYDSIEYYKTWDFQANAGQQIPESEAYSLPIFYKAYFVGATKRLEQLEVFKEMFLDRRYEFNANEDKHRVEWFDRAGNMIAFEDYNYYNGLRKRIRHESLFYLSWNDEVDQGENLVSSDEVDRQGPYYRVLVRTAEETIEPIQANALQMDDHLNVYAVQRSTLDDGEDLAYYTEWDYEYEQGKGRILPQPNRIHKVKLIQPYNIPPSDIQIQYFKTWDYVQKTGTPILDERSIQESTSYYKAYFHNEFPNQYYQIDAYKDNTFQHRYVYKVNLSLYFQEWDPFSEEPVDMSQGVNDPLALEDPSHFYRVWFNYYNSLIWIEKVEHFQAQEYEFPESDTQIHYYLDWDEASKTPSEPLNAEDAARSPQFFKTYAPVDYPDKIYKVERYNNQTKSETWEFPIDFTCFFQDWQFESKEPIIMHLAAKDPTDLQDQSFYYRTQLRFYQNQIIVVQIAQLQAPAPGAPHQVLVYEGTNKRTPHSTEYYTLEKENLGSLFQVAMPYFYWDPFQYIDAIYHTIFETERYYYRRVFKTIRPNQPPRIKAEYFENGVRRALYRFDEYNRHIRDDLFDEKGQNFEYIDYEYDDFGHIKRKEHYYFGQSLEATFYHYDPSHLLVRVNIFKFGQHTTYKTYLYDYDLLCLKEEIYSAKTEQMVAHSYTYFTQDGVLDRKEYYSNNDILYTIHFTLDGAIRQMDRYNDLGKLREIRNYGSRNRIMKRQFFQDEVLIKYWTRDENFRKHYFDPNGDEISEERFHEL